MAVKRVPGSGANTKRKGNSAGELTNSRQYGANKAGAEGPKASMPRKPAKKK